jgi:hypothetical protein
LIASIISFLCARFLFDRPCPSTALVPATSTEDTEDTILALDQLGDADIVTSVRNAVVRRMLPAGKKLSSSWQDILFNPELNAENDDVSGIGNRGCIFIIADGADEKGIRESAVKVDHFLAR